MSKHIPFTLFFSLACASSFPLHSDVINTPPTEIGSSSTQAQEKLLIFIEDVILCLRNVMEEPGCHKRERAQALRCCYRCQERLLDAQRTLQRWQGLGNMRAKRLVERLKDSVDDMLAANELTLKVVKEKTKDPLSDMEHARAKWDKAKERLHDISKALIDIINCRSNTSDESSADFAPLSPRQRGQLASYIDRIFKKEIEPVHEKIRAAERGDLADFTFSADLSDILNIRSHLKMP